MWTNESLFLRESLQIPVEQTHVSLFNGQSPALASTSSTNTGAVLTNIDNNNAGSSNGAAAKKADTDISPDSGFHDGKDFSAKDYLSRFDNSLATIRSNVQKLEEETR